jgi:hypothetical protein
MTNTWAKSNIIISVLAIKVLFACSKINYLQFYDIYVTKNGRTKQFFPPPLGALLDPGWIKISIRDPG